MVDVRTAALIVAFALTGCGKKGPKSATDGAVDLATRAGGDPVQRHPASDACFTTHGGPDWVFSGANDVVDGAGGAWGYVHQDGERWLSVGVLPAFAVKSAEFIARDMIESLPEGRVYDAFSLDVSGRPGGVWAAGVQLAHQDNLYGSDATSRRARLPAKQQIGDDLIATPAATWVFPMEGYFLIGLIVWTDIQSDPHALVQEVAPWSGLPCEEVRSEARKLKITDFHGSLPAESP